MAASANDLFKFVSLRGPADDLVIDPGEIVVESHVLDVLAGMSVDPANPSPEVLARLEAVQVLTEEELAELVLDGGAAVVYSEAVSTFDDLAAATFPHHGRQVSLEEFVDSREFPVNYRAVFDSWLVRRLRGERPRELGGYERLLRGGYLLQRLATAADALRARGDLARLREARLRLPADWGPARARLGDVRARHAGALAELERVATSDTTRRAQQIRLRRAELGQLIPGHEAIQRQVFKSYFTVTQGQTAGAAVPTQPASLDDRFYDLLENRLTEEQRTLLQNAIATFPGGRPTDLDDLIGVLDVGVYVKEANQLCAELRGIEEVDQQSLPVAEPAPPTELRPLVTAVGWGDLVVAREQLVGYDAREIAHIENVLPGEGKLREHERVSKTEQVEETETISEKETEKDSQTTDRYELQTQSQETINQDFSIQAGINTSGRYGLTQVDTSLDSSLRQSRSQSHSSSMNVAREIVSRAVERTLESTRRLRRLTITEEIRELNRHQLDNAAVEGSEPAAVSGAYIWVEKIHQVQLRHYGKRLMVEFHIPEPALSLLERGSQASRRRQLPPFDIGPQDVTFEEYLCLAQRYRATDIEPPPAQFIDVGFKWASAPSESAERDAEDTIGEIIAVPEGYRPVSGSVVASAMRVSGNFDIYVVVGGITVVGSAVNGIGAAEFQFPAPMAWPVGVPVSARSHGHFDKTLIIQVALRCERTPEAVTAWQLRTWEALRAGYEGLARQLDIEAQQEALASTLLVTFEGRPEAENRRIEREELQKWAIKAMRLKPQNFNAVEQVGDFQEISPLNADMQASIARFFEDAFEWQQMSYFLYPYYWARRATWPMRGNVDAVDSRFKAFLGAGAARVIVPVTPGYEPNVLHYLVSDPEADELDRIKSPASEEPPPGSIFEDVWVELLIDRKAEVALGSGTLSVTHGSDTVAINDDSNWRATRRDLGREIYIGGERYAVAAVVAERELRLDRPYQGPDADAAVYATGSVPFGPPWLVNIPTSLVVLAENRDALKAIV